MNRFFTCLTLAASLCGVMQASLTNPKEIGREKAKTEFLNKKRGIRTVCETVPFQLPERKAKKAPGEFDITNLSLNQLSEDKYLLGWFAAVEKETGIMLFSTTSQWDDIQLLSGDYIFISQGMDMDTDATVLLVDEAVSMNGSTATYDIDFTRCTDPVKMEMLMPDGSVAQCPMIDLDTWENLEEGNLRYGEWYTYMSVGIETFEFQGGTMDRFCFDDWSTGDEVTGSMWVNPGITTVSIIQMREMLGEDAVYYNSTVVSPLVEGIYANDPGLYQRFENPAEMTVAADVEPLNWMQMTEVIVLDGNYDRVTSTYNWMGEWSYLPVAMVGFDGRASEYGLRFFGAVANLGMYDYGYTNSEENLVGVTCPPMTNLSDEGYVSAADAFGLMGPYNAYVAAIMNNNQVKLVWRPEEVYSFSSKEREIKDFDSCPILVAEQLWYSKRISEEWGLRNTLLHSYKGYCGDVRTIDLVGETINLKVNGVEQDWQSFETFPTFQSYITSASTLYPGDWDIEIIDNNVNVNGKKGKNVTNIHFNDSENDVCAPTLTMLQPRDADNNITATFSTKDEASFYMSYGDFTPNYDGNISSREWMTVRDCEVKVECTPTGKEEWELLDVDPITEDQPEVGWGYLSKITFESLGDVTEPTDFDLRITLTDRVGNYQVQVLSPALTIKGTSGVASLYAPSASEIYYNLQGLRVDQPHEGEIYIVCKKGESPRKMLYRK